MISLVKGFMVRDWAVTDRDSSDDIVGGRVHGSGLGRNG